MTPLDHALPGHSFSVERLVLMRSTLHPDGARHHEMETFPLGD
jgi:2'-5' RNA ligase